MPPGPGDIARKQIDRMLEQADWAVQDAKAVNLYELMTPMMKESIDRNNVPKVTLAKGNGFCQKITYKTTGRKPEDLIAEFHTGPMPRIAVTVDMIATGTDIKPLEVVLFMRSVKSRSFFEQMKGRGVLKRRKRNNCKTARFCDNVKQAKAI